MVSSNRRLYQDLIKSWINIIPALCLGTLMALMAYCFQIQEYKFKEDAEQKKYEKEAATKIFEVNSKLIDKIVLDFRLYDRKVVDKKTCKQSYIEWKENYTGHKALVKKYFGDTALKNFEFIDHELNNLFNELFNGSDTITHLNLTKLNQIEPKIIDFNSQLIADLLANNVGSYRKP